MYHLPGMFYISQYANNFLCTGFGLSVTLKNHGKEGAPPRSTFSVPTPQPQGCGPSGISYSLTSSSLKELGSSFIHEYSILRHRLFLREKTSVFSVYNMAEALSVAGSAVGVISLAITTCQGVLSYYNSWENQNQSVSDAKSGIERLRNSLSALEVILPKVSSSSAIAGHVEQCVLSCKEGTARLEQFLGKCRKNPAPVSLPDKLREYRHKAIFPFRQSSLDSLNNIVRDLEGNLGTALQVLQLYVTLPPIVKSLISS